MPEALAIVPEDLALAVDRFTAEFPSGPPPALKTSRRSAFQTKTRCAADVGGSGIA
jgi:hypothetical protein